MRHHLRPLLSVVALVVTMLVAAPASAAESRAERLAGPTREATAVEVARADYANGTDTAIIARSDEFADALAATALAGQAHAPILLTPSDRLAEVTADALAQLGVQRVWLAGGEEAISSSVEQQLQAEYEVTRLAGEDRYATAAAIARRTEEDYGDPERPAAARTAFLARADEPWDAMSAGAPAAASDDPMPLLLTDPTELPEVTVQTIDDLEIATLVVAGGVQAIDPAVVEAIQERTGVSVRRVAGPDRYATSVAIADFGRERQAFDAHQMVATRADDWADALTAAPHAGNQYGPLVAVGTPRAVAPAVRDWMLEHCGEIELVTLVGGPHALSQDVAEDLLDYASCTRPADDDGLLERGEEGPAVRDVQQRLSDMGYWIGPIDGAYGQLTEQAVVAFQKVNGLARDGVVGPEVRAAMDDPRPPRAQSTAGYWVEVDEARQVLKFVQDGHVTQVFNTSTGTEEPYTYEGEQYMADTPNGQWDVYRQIDGWRESHLGRLWRPKYFHTDGIAIHGYENVPPYPASHGCVRVTIEAMNHLWESGALPIGTRVWVY